MLYGWLKLYIQTLDKIFGVEYEPYKGYKEDKIRYEGLPKGCWHCPLLGICRRPKEQGWKCYRGCMIINAREKEENNKTKQHQQYSIKRNLYKNSIKTIDKSK